MSLNLHRRHLDESQRMMVAANIANLEGGAPFDAGLMVRVDGRKGAHRLRWMIPDSEIRN